MATNLQSIKPDRPNIITSQIEGIKFYRKMDTQSVVAQMIAGKYVFVEEYYSNGLQVLAELKKNLSEKFKDKSFQGQRDYRSAFRKASHRLLIKVKDNKLINNDKNIIFLSKSRNKLLLIFSNNLKLSLTENLSRKPVLIIINPFLYFLLFF